MTRKLSFAAGFILLAFPLSGGAAPPDFKFTGTILGIVNDTAGVPQMGATVYLINRYHRLVSHVMSDERGGFRFNSLTPDTYTVRVTLSNFLTATKANIGIEPGIEKIINVNLMSAINSIELIYAHPGQPAMSDEWKWVLRTSTATRPILRALPQDWNHTEHSSLFSNTSGIVRLSAGDTTFLPTLGSQPDLGTAFALATSLYGSNRLQFSANMGYASQSGLPAAGFRTTFSRQMDSGLSPEVTVTMRQLFLPQRAGTAFATGPADGTPGLRTISITLAEHTQITDSLRLDYGASMEAVSFIQRLNYFSPYAMFTYNVSKNSEVEFGYSSGLPPVELLARNAAGADWGQQQSLAALSLFPRVSLRDGQARVQRVENFEIGYRRVAGSRTFSLAAYREAVSNAALTTTAADGSLASRDYLPDLFSAGAIFNAGRYKSVGYTASVTQALGDRWGVTLAYGNGGALQLARNRLMTNDPDELRGLIRSERRHWVSTRVTGVTPVTNTKISASYEWTDASSLTPGHYYMTQRVQPETGLNIVVRQRIPAPSGMPGKLEATAELRNMLAQGYLPVTMADNQRMLLVSTPRALRGGLAFIF